MPIPVGTYPVGGPLVSLAAGLPTATVALRNAGAVGINDNAVWQVNAAGDEWIRIPGHTLHSGSAAPTTASGLSGDWYIQTSNGHISERVGNTWHTRYNRGAQLSDTCP